MGGIRPASGGWSLWQTLTTSRQILPSTLPGTPTYSGTSVLLNVSTSELAAVTYSLNGASNLSLYNFSTQGSTTVTASVGSNILTVYGNDSAGNLNSAVVYFTVDASIPSISFVLPTDVNGTTLTNRSYTFVNVTLSEDGTAWLDWNGTNESMAGGGSNWYLNKTGLSRGDYAYRVWANATAGNLNGSETRTIKIEVLNDTTPSPAPPVSAGPRETPEIPEPVDLYIEPQDIIISKTEPVDGDLITVSATIHSSLEDAVIEVEFSVDGVTGEIVALDYNSSSKADFRWQATEGVHAIRVRVDPHDEIVEEDEDNNMAEKILNVTAQPGIEPAQVLETMREDSSTGVVLEGSPEGVVENPGPEIPEGSTVPTDQEAEQKEPPALPKETAFVVLAVSGTSAAVIIGKGTAGKGSSSILSRVGWADKLPFPFLIGRIKRESKSSVLGNRVRTATFYEIVMSPGIHFRELKRRLEVSDGTLTWHLGVLEGAGMIRSEKGKYYKSYFPRGNFPIKGRKFTPSPTKQRVLEVVNSSPGLTQKTIAKRVGTTPSTVLYHLKQLEDMEMVVGTRDGRQVRYFGMN
jgi:DNA-binding MarR family transcriptional regulator